MAAANGLSLIPNKDVQLSELESNLIAKTILFQKIHLLPRSRMSACKDQLINIPISSEDVINTLERLPRTPNERRSSRGEIKKEIGIQEYTSAGLR